MISTYQLFSRILASVVLMWGALLPLSAHAVDSYRYAHVTIETPWMIFLFLLVIILLPFILMAILYWRFTFQKKAEGKDAE